MRSIRINRILKIVIVAAFAATGCSAFMPSSVGSSSGLTLNEADAQASVYRANCARCHGNDGHANTREGRRVEADDLTEDSVKRLSDEKMTRIIKKGKGNMPAFKKLSTSQISGLIRYVRSL